MKIHLLMTGNFRLSLIHVSVGECNRVQCSIALELI